MVKDAHERCEQKPTTLAFQNERPCERLPKGFRVEKLANPSGCPLKINVVDDILGLIGQFLKIFYRIAQRIIWKKLCACEKRCVRSRSLATMLRPAIQASSATVPDPENGSYSKSPGSVNCNMSEPAMEDFSFPIYGESGEGCSRPLGRFPPSCWPESRPGAPLA